MRGCFGDLEDWGLSICPCCRPRLKTVRDLVLQIQNLVVKTFQNLAGFRREVVEMARSRESSSSSSFKDTLLGLLRNMEEEDGGDDDDESDPDGHGGSHNNMVFKNELTDEEDSVDVTEDEGVWFFDEDEDEALVSDNDAIAEHEREESDLDSNHSPCASPIDRQESHGNDDSADGNCVPYPLPRNKSRRKRSSTESGIKRARREIPERQDITKKNTPRKRQFRCPEDDCIQYFDTEVSRDAHYKRKHLGILLCFECSKCTKGFRRACDVSVHERSCKGVVKHLDIVERPRSFEFCCPEPSCLQLFPSERSRDAHHRRVHLGILLCFECPKCGKGFKRSCDLNPHERICVGIPNLDAGPSGNCCPECRISCANRKMLQQHIIEKHVSKCFLYSCSVCLEAFKETNLLHDHVMSHPEDQLSSAFACFLCKLGFDTTILLESHVDDAHRCPHCPGNMHYKNKATHIGNVHTKAIDFDCEFCDNGFPDKHTLSNHMIFKHSEQLGLEPFECTICKGGKKFNSCRRLRAHMKQIHDVDLDTLTCEICSRGFYHNGLLSLHKKSHEREGEDGQIFCCDICGKCLNSARRLRGHMFRWHSAEGQSMCELCGAVMTKIGMKKHKCKLPGDSGTKTKGIAKGKKLKEGQSFKEGPPICEVCGLKFLNHKTLLNHAKVHNSTLVPKQRPIHYICSVCEVRFPTRPKLNQHLADAHQLPPTARLKPPGRTKRQQTQNQ